MTLSFNDDILNNVIDTDINKALVTGWMPLPDNVICLTCKKLQKYKDGALAFFRCEDAEFTKDYQWPAIFDGVQNPVACARKEE